jgi:hypothetical protein
VNNIIPAGEINSAAESIVVSRVTNGTVVGALNSTELKRIVVYMGAITAPIGLRVATFAVGINPELPSFSPGDTAVRSVPSLFIAPRYNLNMLFFIIIPGLDDVGTH